MLISVGTPEDEMISLEFVQSRIPVRILIEDRGSTQNPKSFPPFIFRLAIILTRMNDLSRLIEVADSLRRVIARDEIVAVLSKFIASPILYLLSYTPLVHPLYLFIYNNLFLHSFRQTFYAL